MENKFLKTPYEWCVEANIRLFDLNEWPHKTNGSIEKHFYEFNNFSKENFLKTISECRVITNSHPRKTDMYLEYRMYGLVNYQLSGTIHAGIQFGHGVVEYQQNIKDIQPIEKIYNKWASKDKTFIILNGGTTNDSKDYTGTLQKHRNTLLENGILISEFREPDLNNALTAVCFLVDERVWNKELYEDFIPEKLPPFFRRNKKREDEVQKRNNENYNHWLDKIGGPKNLFLREFLKNFKLA